MFNTLFFRHENCFYRDRPLKKKHRNTFITVILRFMEPMTAWFYE